jgi:peptidoglycan hydrolase CwlO-like protein
MSDNSRRVANKPKDTPIDVNTENIKIKEIPVQTIEQKVAAIEAYIVGMDPYIKSTISSMTDVKNKIDVLDAEITRIAGVQSRANSYLDNKLNQIDKTFESLVIIVKKLDEDYKDLMSDVEYQDTPDDKPETEDK